VSSYLGELDQRKRELEEQYPGWQIWFVPHVDWTVTWCARPNPLLNEDSPEHLSEAIRQAHLPAAGPDAAAPPVSRFAGEQ
jgi:hypothetical protein